MLGHNLLAHGFAFGCGSVSLKPWAEVIVFVVTAFGAESSDAAVGCSLSPVGVTTDFAGVYFLWWGVGVLVEDVLSVGSGWWPVGDLRHGFRIRVGCTPIPETDPV